MTAAGRRDLPDGLLATAVRALPAGRRDWGQAMRAELATVAPGRDRWGFALSCLRAVVAQGRPVLGGAHLIAVLVAATAVFVWATAMDYPPLVWGLYVVVATLAAVFWQARRDAMLGPIGDGGLAWLLRVGGYLLAGGIVAGGIAGTEVTRAHPGTDAGTGALVFSVTGASYLIALATVCARRSAATARTLVTGAGAGLAAAAVWLAIVLLVPPIPASTGGALALTGIAAVTAAAANSSRGGTPQRGLLAALLAAATSMALIFVAVVLLASYGPDSLIPAITPHALPANRVSESRIEIVDPYILLVALGALTATALGVASVATRRPSMRSWRRVGITAADSR